jgi:1-acyl-sn-glycerol-3-phosphate acyltransferase
MRRLRAAWRLFCTVLHGLHGLAIVLLRFPSLDAAGRQSRVRWWSARTLRLLGLRLEASGQFRPGAKLIVANHVSWIDIMAIHAICPEARFVSKADVQHWPLMGRLISAGGTLYIERERRRDAMRVVHEMAAALQSGQTVAVFPEGTVSDGRTMLPFHANLLQAAIATATPIQPVAIRYADASDAISRAADFSGTITIAQSLWMLACGEGVVARLTILPAEGSAHADRRALAELLRTQIAQTLESS